MGGITPRNIFSAMEGLPLMEASGQRTVPRLGELSSPGFEERVAPEYAASPALVAFFFGSGAEEAFFPLGLSIALPFLLGKLVGSSLGCFSPIITSLAWEGSSPSLGADLGPGASILKSPFVAEKIL